MRRLLHSLAMLVMMLGLVGTPTITRAADEKPAKAVEAKGESEKKPELIDPNKSEAIWTIVIFLILFFLLKQTAWKNIVAGLKAREERIRKDIADAEAARLKAEATLKDYNAQLATADAKVRETLSAATTEAERIGASIRARAQQESEETKERALKDIEAARKQALAEIYDQAATLSTSIAEKIIRRSLNADDQRDLVARSLEQLQGIGKN